MQKNCFLLLLLFSSCIRIPVQSVALTQAIAREGERMHSINLLLLADLFAVKKKEAVQFVNNSYIPELTAGFLHLLPDTVDIRKHFPRIQQSLQLRISAMQDSLLTALEEQKERLAAKLNTDYRLYETATTDLSRLISSAIKVEKQRDSLITALNAIPVKGFSLAQVRNTLDNFLYTTGSAGNKIAALRSGIDQLINQ